MQDISWKSRFGRALGVSYLSLATQSYNVNVLSTPAKINVFGFTVFLFGFGLTYTANLAAQLTIQHASNTLNSFEEALAHDNYRFCTTRTRLDMVRLSYPQALPARFVADGVDGLPGFNDEIDRDGAARAVLQRINPHRADYDNQFCHGAIVSVPEVENMQAQAQSCDIVITGEAVVSE